MKARRARKKPATGLPASESATAKAAGNKPPPLDLNSRIKRAVFGILASVLAPAVLLGILELVLRLTGFGYPTHFFLPGQIDGQKILHENQQFGWRFFPPVAARTPRPVVLSPTKPPQTCRIFVFGESAAYGDPSPAFGLPRVLEVLLRNRYPSVHFEVVNVAMTAINSNVILPIARDCADKDGDIWILYMGNNEVVGPYGGGTVFGRQVPRLPLIRASIAVNATRIGQMLARLRDALRGKSSVQPNQISLELFLENQLRHDDPRMERVYGHFSRNLKDIVETGIKSGAKVVVSTVASNLRDCAPFASLHRPDLSDAQKLEWDRLYQDGTKVERTGQTSQALEAYRRASAIDDQWADLQFNQARSLWNAGDIAGASNHFILARDYDALRFRADFRINDIIRRTCSQRLKDGVAFLDGNDVLAQHSPHGVPGEELLYEHVHLNFTGNYLLARAFAQEISNLKPATLVEQVPAQADWLSEEECSSQLGLNDWDRYQTLELLRQRIEGPPFTQQLNHREEYEHIQKQIADCKVSLSNQTMSPAIQRCERALSFSPNDWVLHEKLAQLLAQSPDKALQTRAVQELRQVIALVPHYPDVHYELGVLLDQAQGGEAETQLRLALSLKRNYYPNALNALGRLLAGQNRLAEAIDNYERAIRLKPNFPEALVNWGVALNRVGRTAEAQTRFEEALRLSPNNTEAAVNLGKSLDQKGELSVAVARYTEMLRADPNNAGAHYNLARCFGLMGRSAEAQQHYLEALRLQPDFAEAHGQLAMELFKAGKEAEALQHFQEAVRLKPDSAEVHKNLGIALAKLRRFDEAAREFESTTRLDPNDATARTYLEAARRSQVRTK